MNGWMGWHPRYSGFKQEDLKLLNFSRLKTNGIKTIWTPVAIVYGRTMFGTLPTVESSRQLERNRATAIFDFAGRAAASPEGPCYGRTVRVPPEGHTLKSTPNVQVFGAGVLGRQVVREGGAQVNGIITLARGQKLALLPFLPDEDASRSQQPATQKGALSRPQPS